MIFWNLSPHRPIVSVLAQKYGKRPQFLFAATVGLVGTIVCIGGRSNYSTLLAGRIIQGLGATAFESLTQAAIGDMFYIHERGWRTASVVLSLAMASMVSIISGVITEHLGWRDLFIISLPFNIVGWLATFFLLPEMQFRRESPAEIRRSDAMEGQESVSQIEISHKGKIHSPGGTHSSTNVKRSYTQDLRVFSGTYTKDNIFKLLAEIFIHLLNPAVQWILTISAVLVVCYSALFSILVTEVLQSAIAGSFYTMAQIWSVP